MISWGTVKEEFASDGSLRDIYFVDVNLATWQKFLNLLRESSYKVRYLCEGNEREFDWNAETIFNDVEHRHLIQIEKNGIILNSHFFTEEEIELDVSPEEISSQKSLDVLLEFIEYFGNELDSKVIFTPENCQESPIFVKWRAGEKIQYLQQKS